MRSRSRSETVYVTGILEGRQRQNRNIWRNNGKNFPDIEIFKSYIESAQSSEQVKEKSTEKHNIRIIKTIIDQDKSLKASRKKMHTPLQRKNNTDIRLLRTNAG